MGICHSPQSKQTREENSTLDTLNMARQEREKQGRWEAEISYGGEADLHRHLGTCTKNPGHLKFVPVDKFRSVCHDEEIVSLVEAISDLTVRVSVKYVSEERPKKFPGSNKPYPCYSNRGKNMMRVGTGWVWRVLMNSEDNDKNNKTMDGKECPISSTPRTPFAHICILTAAHVVYDELEGAHTTCDLFFDRGGTPDTCSGVVTLSGMSRVWSDVYEDWSRMVYVTEDMDLARRLFKMVAHFRTHKASFISPASDMKNSSPKTEYALKKSSPKTESAMKKSSPETKSDMKKSSLESESGIIRSPLQAEADIVRSPIQAESNTGKSPLKERYDIVRSPIQAESNKEKSPLKERYDIVRSPPPVGCAIDTSPLQAGFDIGTSVSQITHLPDTKQKLAIIVSHPHGCSKQVSIGRWTSRQKMGKDRSLYTYTAATCPGSSGARVFVFLGKYWRWWECAHIHSGKFEGRRDINYCGFVDNHYFYDLCPNMNV